jgi:hypothetical protein
MPGVVIDGRVVDGDTIVIDPPPAPSSRRRRT